MEKNDTCQQNGKVRRGPMSGQVNTSYVRKRKKIDFSLESGDDSDEWDDGKKGKKKKGKGRNAGRRAGKINSTGIQNRMRPFWIINQ